MPSLDLYRLKTGWSSLDVNLSVLEKFIKGLTRNGV
jgi:hypothetical protein